MNCQTARSLLSEFLDECLPAATAWEVQTHLSDCAACARLRLDLDSLRRTLQALPTRQPSASFDAALAQRLALTRRPAPQRTWRDRFAWPLQRPVPLLRPAFALGVGLAAVGGILFLPAHSPPPVPTAARAVHSADPAFVADCVAQHRRDAVAEPLADLAAQNLAGHLDNAGTGEPAPASADSEVF